LFGESKIAKVGLMVGSAHKKRGTAQTRVRAREIARARLIEAVGILLARKCFTALGMNAVTREAGVDKVLICSYFGGLLELVVAFGRDGNFWPSIKELAGGDVEAYRRLPVTEQLPQLSRNFMTAIRTRPITQEIPAWEMIEQNELTAELETIRENTISGCLLPWIY
jgi:AcrR family transcriptional regulator